MKKISLLFASLVAVLGFTSCNDDTTPRLENPANFDNSNFVLYEPVFANQYIELTEDGTVDFTVSGQPNFGGVSVITNYALQVSLTPEFKRNVSKVMSLLDADGNEVLDANGDPLPYVPEPGDYVELRNPGTQSDMKVQGLLIARAITKLQGYTDEATYPAQQYQPIYVRVRAYQPQAPEISIVTRNYQCLNFVKSFFSLDEPGFIWLVGKPTAWAQDAASLGDNAKVYEARDQIDSKIYHWEGEIAKGDFQFRFYTELGDWDKNSLGTQVDDNPIDLTDISGATFEDGVFFASYVEGKGSWEYADWEGGKVKITVDMNNGTVEFVLNPAE